MSRSWQAPLCVLSIPLSSARSRESASGQFAYCVVYVLRHLSFGDRIRTLPWAHLGLRLDGWWGFGR